MSSKVVAVAVIAAVCAGPLSSASCGGPIGQQSPERDGTATSAGQSDQPLPAPARMEVPAGSARTPEEMATSGATAPPGSQPLPFRPDIDPERYAAEKAAAEAAQRSGEAKTPSGRQE